MPPSSPFAAGPRRGLLAASLFLLASSGGSQTPEEHASHHPGKSAVTSAPKKPTEKAGPASMGGGSAAPSGGMGDMMKGMMGDDEGASKEIYPSLMGLPSFSPEDRSRVQRMAHARMRTAMAQVNSGLDEIARAATHLDYVEMQTASEKARQGLALYESGLAAARGLADGAPADSVALRWFQRDTSLLPPTEASSRPTSFGMPSTWFHYLVIAILASFVAAMLAMYFYKMRRANALFTRLAVGEASPPAPAGTPQAAAAAPAPQTGAPAPLSAAPTPSVPGKGRWKGQLRVARVFDETPDVKTFRLVLPSGGPLPFTFLPGQFAEIAVPTDEGDRKPVKRSYTIASAPAVHDHIELTVKREDAPGAFHVSSYLHDTVKEGDEIPVAVPAGKFTFTGKEADSIVLVAGGVGITPMMSIVRQMTAQGWPGEIYLLVSCRTTANFIFREELEYLERRFPNLRVFATMTRARGDVWMGPSGYLTKDVIAGFVPEIATRRVHVCGPVPMMDSVAKCLTELGVPKEQIHTESFATVVAPPPASTPAVPAATVATATFSVSGKTAPLTPTMTVLECAESIGVDIDAQCRVGTCGTCITRLLAGAVTMAIEDGLEPEEKAAGMILACQARSAQDVTVEA